jgi:hypothetical protein
VAIGRAQASEDEAAQCHETQAADRRHDGDHGACLREFAEAGRQELEGGEGRRADHEADQGEAAAFPLCGEPADPFGRAEGESAVQFVRETVLTIEPAITGAPIVFRA